MKASVLRSLVVSIAVVAIGFIILDRVFSCGLDEVVKQSGFRFSKLYAGGQNADVLVLGNSRAVNAFYAPDLEEQLGKSVFHLGYNGMSMEICETLLADYLEHNSLPSLLLLEVTNLHIASTFLKDLKLYSAESLRLQALMSRDYKWISVSCKLTHLFRFNSELFQRVLFYYSRSDQSWINSGSANSEFAKHYRPSRKEIETNIYPISGSNWQALLRIIKLCQSRSIELRLVATPYLPNHRNHLVNYADWLAVFRAALPRGVHFYDFTDVFCENEYFADPLHMTREGGVALLEVMSDFGVFE